MKKNITLAEFQEILLWQSLNKQLLVLKKKGKNIKKSQHKYLQTFCFDNMLFSTITAAPFLDETPLSLVSDFKSLSFVTSNTREWIKVLSQVIPNVSILDIEKALADSFDVLSKYDRKYNLTRSGDEESDDEELYKFIDEYIQKKESIGTNLSNIINESYSLKAMVLKKIIKLYGKSIVETRNNELLIDLKELKKDTKEYERISGIYKNEYLSKVEPQIGHGNKLQRVLQKQSISEMLHNKITERDVKKSVKEFVEHEIPIHKKELQLIDDFTKGVQKYLNKDLPKISICHIKPFEFTRHPFPTI